MKIIRKAERYLERFKLTLIGMGFLKYVPLIVCYVYVPLVAYAIMQIDTENYKTSIIIEQMYLYFPIVAGWWGNVMMEMSLEISDELLTTYEKTKWLDVVLSFVMFVFSLSPLIAFLLNKYSPDKKDFIAIDDFIGILAMCLFFVGINYMFTCITKSTVVGFAIMVALDLYGSSKIRGFLELLGFGLNESLFDFDEYTYMLTGAVCIFIGTFVLQKVKD